MAPKAILGLFLILAAAFAAVAIADPALELPHEVFFYQPVASAWGQIGFWNNPASLGAQQSGNILIFTHRDNRLVRDWGTAATWKFMGLGYRKINNEAIADTEELIFGFGGGTKLRMGTSYRYFREGPGHLNNRHIWTIGLQSHYSENVVVGLRAENLNRGRINGQRSDIRYVYGIGMRAYKDLVSLSLDVNQTHKQSVHSAEFRTGVDVRPIPGLYVFADVSNKSGFNLGVRVNIETEYLTHYHSFDKNGKGRLGTTAIGMVNGRQPSLVSLEGKTLQLSLAGTLPENPKLPVFGNKPPAFYDYVAAVYDAATDEGIDRILLRIGTLRCGLARTEELGQALTHFRSQGKMIIAYLDQPDNLGYLMASFADSVIVPPVSQFSLIGLRAHLKTYTGLFDKLGLEVEIERVAAYKSAPERYFLDEPSEQQRETINRLLDSMYIYMVETIADNRRLSVETVKALIDQGPLSPAEAVAAGLVDGREYYDELDRRIAGHSRRISLHAYINEPKYDDRWSDPPRVAVLLADGGIGGETSSPRVGEQNLIPKLRSLAADNSVAGVVLRINSPGGLALPADIIWHEIDKLSKKKPLVISLGNVAASGGYYITAIDSPIYASRNTITGSIGVYAGKANIINLYDKLGIHSETYGRGKNSRFFSMITPYTPDQRIKLKSHLQLMYDHFVEKVANSRGLSADSVNQLGEGRVWTGAEAVANGLVDDIGGVHKALSHLIDICELKGKEYEIVWTPKQYYIWENPFDIYRWIDTVAGFMAGENGPSAAFSELLSGDIYFRLPYNLTIE